MLHGKKFIFAFSLCEILDSDTAEVSVDIRSMKIDPLNGIPMNASFACTVLLEYYKVINPEWESQIAYYSLIRLPHQQSSSAASSAAGRAAGASSQLGSSRAAGRALKQTVALQNFASASKMSSWAAGRYIIRCACHEKVYLASKGFVSYSMGIFVIV